MSESASVASTEATPTTNSIVATATPTARLRSYLEAPAVLAQLAKALPKPSAGEAQMAAVRLVRQALTLCQQNQNLIKCDLKSILAAVMQAAELGLDLTGPLGHAYLIPRWNKQQRVYMATIQIGYRGLIYLACRGGQVRNITARTVYSGDEFAIDFGTEQKIRHVPALQNRGEPVGYYAVAFLKDGTDFEFLSHEEMVAHRNRFSPPGDKFSPWDTDWNAMAQKTVIRMLCKRLPMATEAASVAMLDEYQERGIPTPLVSLRPEGAAIDPFFVDEATSATTAEEGTAS
jgi:recombination protein RecT